MAWFQDTFGFKENRSYQQNRSMFRMEGDVLVCDTAPPAARRQHVGPFTTPSVAELRADLPEEMVNPQIKKEHALGSLSFCHIGDNVTSLICDERNADSVFQAASQFNCLEMVGPGVTPRQGITGYAGDPTQGPKCALACPAGTVYRNYLCQGGKGQGDIQIDCLEDVANVFGGMEVRGLLLSHLLIIFCPSPFGRTVFLLVGAWAN